MYYTIKHITKLLIVYQVIINKANIIYNKDYNNEYLNDYTTIIILFYLRGDEFNLF